MKKQSNGFFPSNLSFNSYLFLIFLLLIYYNVWLYCGITVALLVDFLMDNSDGSAISIRQISKIKMLYHI